jgi:hypothetical protein
MFRQLTSGLNGVASGSPNGGGTQTVLSQKKVLEDMHYNACFHSLARWRSPNNRPDTREARHHDLKVLSVLLVPAYEIRCTAMEMNYLESSGSPSQQFIDISVAQRREALWLE